MNNKNISQKQLVIIAGAAGPIGQEVLRHYLLDKEILVYGISRRGTIIDSMDTLPDHNMIVKVDLNNTDAIKKFITKLPLKNFEKINYYHLVGEFKTEINNDLQVVVENDFDNDGIDDDVYHLTTGAYISMTEELMEFSAKTQSELSIVSLGSLADKYLIPCFQSFSKSKRILKDFSRKMWRENNKINFYLFETSTVLAAVEMIDRPFIFATNADPNYWITPFELVQRMFGFIQSEKGIVEKEIYLANPNFPADYFDPFVTYKRRVKELYNREV
jgi:NADP-dependent 3-hydroxy acid dehydrogenase YdfG